MITQIATEIRNIGLVCAGLGLTLYGIKIFFRHRLDELGETLSSYAIGGMFVGTGLTVPAILLGFAASSPLVAGPPLVDLADSLSSVVSFWLWQGPLMVGSMWAWRRMFRG